MSGPDILKATSRRIISSFEGSQDVSRDSGLASFEGRDSWNFKAKEAAKFGIRKVYTRRGIPQISIGITGLGENLGRKVAVKAYWGPDLFWL